MRLESAAPIRSDLSWTHYRRLLGVENVAARTWYMHEAADQHWSTRQLDRQISVLYYERLLASREKAAVRREAVAKLAPEVFIRDPIRSVNILARKIQVSLLVLTRGVLTSACGDVWLPHARPPSEPVGARGGPKRGDCPAPRA